MLEKLFRLFFAGSLVLMTACNGDPNATKLQYMPDMADAPTIKAQENYIDAPEYSVAMNAIIYPKTAAEAEEKLKNPFAKLPPQEKQKNLTNGKEMFDTFCAVCHGTSATGDGYVVDKFPRPPNLLDETYVNRKDGFFFHKITFGSAIMPSYGHAISPHERWNIILHLRTLQQKAGK